MGRRTRAPKLPHASAGSQRNCSNSQTRTSDPAGRSEAKAALRQIGSRPKKAASKKAAPKKKTGSAGRRQKKSE